MAFITYPLNNIDYTAEDAELFHCTRTSGIWAEDSFSISVTGADNNVTIGKGIAWINNEEFSGKVTALKSAEVLDLGIADSAYPRIDVIAIQFNANNNETDIIVKKGTPGTNPVRPSIVRTGTIYELYLASVYRPAGAIAITASNITDLRMDETLCGLMADSVTKVDMTAIEAQIRAFINNLQNEIDEVKNLSGLMFETEWTEGGVIPVSKGGTGATTAPEARSNLGFDYGSAEPSGTPDTGEGSVYFRTGGDAVVEAGTTGEWTWEKRASGIVRCWGKRTDTFVCSSAAGGLFYSSDVTIPVPSGLFITVENVMVSVGTSTGAGWVVGSRVGTITPSNFKLAYFTTATNSSKDITADYEVIGRWK